MKLAPSTSFYAIDSHPLPWAPLGQGVSFKPLRFLPDNRGYVLLLRLEPGAVIPRHRHTGEAHHYNITGQRRIVETGEIVGPGGYVYEPAGNVESWTAYGDEPVIVHILAHGAVEYLDERGQVVRRTSAETAYETYRRHCEASAVDPVGLFA